MDLAAQLPHEGKVRDQNTLLERQEFLVVSKCNTATNSIVPKRS
jgi:hypothetical protein